MAMIVFTAWRRRDVAGTEAGAEAPVGQMVPFYMSITKATTGCLPVGFHWVGLSSVHLPHWRGAKEAFRVLAPVALGRLVGRG